VFPLARIRRIDSAKRHLSAHPSDDVLRAVSRPLRLTATETDYLLHLARGAGASVDATVPPEIVRVLQATLLPAYVVDRRWYALAWNDAFAPLWSVGDRDAPWTSCA
jgi:hypothetical protein